MNTLDYYNNNADDYYKTTINANMDLDYNKFLKYIPNHSYILDFGCGSGRDSKYFIDNEYKVDALDGSKELCKLASNLIKQPVINKRFEDFNELNKYDGIWACASLLHLHPKEFNQVIKKLIEALKDNGYMYIALKNGDDEEIINNKYYNYFTKEEILNLIDNLNLNLVDYWDSKSVTNKDEPRYWHNFIVNKKRN